MSPPAVDFRSPFTPRPQMQAKHQQSLKPQNPSPNPCFPFEVGAFSLNNFPEQHEDSLRGGSETANYSSVSNASMGGFSSTFVAGSSAEKFGSSAVLGHSKPRLVKMRRQPGSQQMKSTSASAQNDSGLNPIQYVLVNFNDVKNATTGSSNVNAGFEFGVDKSSLMSNLNSEKKQCSGCLEQVSADGVGRLSNMDFLFGVNECSSDTNLNSDHNERERGKDFGQSGFEKIDKDGFLFGASSLLNSMLETRQCSESRKSRANECDEVGFVFGANKISTVHISCREERQSNGSVRQSGSGFEHGDLMSNSYLEKKELGENVQRSASDGRENIKLEGIEKVDNMGFVFGGNWSELRSNLNSVKSESSEDWARSVPIGTQNMKFGSQLGKFNNLGFVFGACLKDSSVVSDSQKRESSGSAGTLEFENDGKMNPGNEVELQKDKTNDVFIFGSSSEKSSSFSKSTELHDEMNKVNSDNYEKNYSGFVNNSINKLGSVSNNEHDLVFGSSVNTISSSETSTVCKLSDMMTNLIVDGSEKIGLAFGSKKISIVSCITPHDLIKNANLRGPGDGGAVEKTESSKVGTTDENIFVFSSGRGATCSSGGGEHHVRLNDTNDLTRSGLGIFNEQVKGGVPFVWEEKKPTNAQEKSSDGPFVSITPKSYAFHVGLGNEHASCSSTAYPKLKKNLEFSSQSTSVRDKKWKKTRRMLRQVIPLQQQPTQNCTPKEGSQQNPESPGCYSPMDFSPYEDNNCLPSTMNVGSSMHEVDEDLAAGREESNICEGEEKRGEHNVDVSKHAEHIVADSFLADADTECSNLKSGGIRINNFGGGVPVDDDHSTTKREDSECTRQFCFSSSAVDTNQGKFTFSASSTLDHFSATKRHNRKRYRAKVSCSPNRTTASCVALHPIQEQYKASVILNSQMEEFKSKADEEHDKQESTAATREACEKWQIRGNQAYKKGSMSKAEEYYTKGINSVPLSETSGCCTEPLVRCYSNRAAARMARGRMREALGDCIMAAAVDPNFHKALLRAANCHLALGEVEDALQYFNKCLDSGSDVCLDRRITIEAANGQQKAQKAAETISKCAELLQQRASNAAVNALDIISVALSICSYSEKLLEMKGEALLMLQRYEEVIQLCEQTLVFAEKNFAMVVGDYSLGNEDVPKYKNSFIRLWRWRLMSKSYFHLGRLEVALDVLEKQELLRSSEDSSLESSVSFAVTIRELLHRKNAGNEAFQSGRYTEAVEHYTAVVSSNIGSRPFTALCFCNRAAAHQALGQIADAIADCSLATALDGSYSKAVSRRATLHEAIRDYDKAASDLHRLISLLEKQSQEKVRQSGAAHGPGSTVEEIRKARRRLSSVQEKAKKEICVDHYLILGVKPSDSTSEIKKAYHKAALRHHPDKAGQFLARREGGYDGQPWKETADEVQKDADRLFKMIGEAYTVLSDSTKRSNHDHQEDLRNAWKERSGSRASRGPSEFYRY